MTAAAPAEPTWDDPRLLHIAEALGVAPGTVLGCYLAVASGERDLEYIAWIQRIPVAKLEGILRALRLPKLKSEEQRERRRAQARTRMRRFREKRRLTLIEGGQS